MNEQPSISKIIFSYLLIVMITGVLITVDGETFSHNSMNTNEYAIVDSIAIINAEANLPIYAVPEEHTNIKSLSVERMQAQATIDSAVIEEHPTAKHDYGTELRNHIWTSMELRERIDEVDGQIQLLTDSMPSPVGRLSSVDQQQPSAIGEESVIEMIQMIEPTAAGTSDTLAIANTGADKSAVDESVKHEMREKDAPGSDKQDSVNISTQSPWVVNLVSLSNKAAADRFSAKARSKDIQAEWYAVTVKGKQYWRVHVSGFSTATEAKSQENIIKEKLGLKDVWITKR
jgi:cell division septation protein DedD